MLSRLFIVALWSPAGKGLTSWLLFVMFNCVFVTFTCGILGQVWYLIVSIPDLCFFLIEGFTVENTEVKGKRTLVYHSYKFNFSTKYLLMCKGYTNVGGIKWLYHGLSTSTGDNPFVKAPGLSPRTGGQTALRNPVEQNKKQQQMNKKIIKKQPIEQQQTNKNVDVRLGQYDKKCVG